MTKNKYNKYTLAIKYFKKANKICPDNRIYEKLFQCYIKRNTFDFIASLDLYLYNEGMCEINRGNIESAIQYFEESNYHSPYAKTYERLYQCYTQIKEFEKADDCIKKAYILRSNNDKIACEYAQTLIKHKKYDKAKKILMKVLRRNNTYKPAKSLLNNIERCN